MLVCEAGTGTGKTLAYLVPAILSGKKIVISTATRALQEQIFNKDIPLIRQTLGLRVDAALDERPVQLPLPAPIRRVSRQPRGRRSTRCARARHRRRMGGSTESGDVADLIGLTEDEPVWREVSSSSETRIGQDCPHFNACFVTRMKREAEAARIVVVNHHLFFADLALARPARRRRRIPNYDAVIFDEAHQLEDIATDFFGVRVSSARVQSMLRDAERAFVSAGLSDKLLRKGEGAAIVEIAREGARTLLRRDRASTRRESSREQGPWRCPAARRLSIATFGAATCSPATTSSMPRSRLSPPTPKRAKYPRQSKWWRDEANQLRQDLGHHRRWDQEPRGVGRSAGALGRDWSFAHRAVHHAPGSSLRAGPRSGAHERDPGHRP